MTFNVSGNIILDIVECCHCDKKIRFSLERKCENCITCGARYIQVECKSDNEIMNCIYDFNGFICKYYNCNNECPLSFMYCTEHCDDKFIISSENSIRDSLSRIENEKEKIKLIEKSKKTWLVTKFK